MRGVSPPAGHSFRLRSTVLDFITWRSIRHRYVAVPRLQVEPGPRNLFGDRGLLVYRLDRAESVRGACAGPPAAASLFLVVLVMLSLGPSRVPLAPFG